MKEIAIKLYLASLLILWGCLQANAQELLSYGKEWTAKCYYDNNDNPPSDDWIKETFDDSGWESIQGPLYASTPRTWDNYCGYWIRRHFNVEDIKKVKYACFYYSVDDAMQVFLNGKEILNLGITSSTQTVMLPDSVVNMIKQGDNVLAVRAYDTGGGDKFADFGLKAFEDIYQGLINSSNEVSIDFVNDERYPWTINGTRATSGNKGVSNTSSSLIFSYSSDFQTQVSFNWCNNHDGQSFLIFVDGVNTDNRTTFSEETKRFFLPAGKHIVEFRDTIWSSHSGCDQTCYISNICVKEIKQIGNSVLTEKSLPLTFSNDETWPWTTEEGFIQSSNYGHSNSISKFSSSFTVTEPSKFSFWSSTYYYTSENTTSSSYSSYHYFSFKINGKEYDYRTNSEGYISVLLEPGDYQLEWSDSIKNTTANLKSRVKEIELSSNWVNVDIASNAGTLGVEVLYLVNVLNDVELLKVTGTINSTDWATIKQMKNLLALDLTDAKFDAVPDYAFDGLSRLSSVKLPEGCKTIGQYAFRGTQIWNIDIPSTVTKIGQFAFYQTRLRTISFKEDSKLEYIGYCAFHQCYSLEEFIMPNTVTKLGSKNDGYSSDYNSSIFSEDTSLKRVHFSDALEHIEQYACYGCTNLTEVHLPANVTNIHDYAFQNTSSLRHIDIPASLKEIDYYGFQSSGIDSISLPLTLSWLGERAFSDCKNLKYIELPSYVDNFVYNFANCTSLEKVVSRSATPPSIKNDPFSGAKAKSTITLVVPSFAVVNYKLDSYWYQFGSIIEGDDIDYWIISSELSLTNNRRMNGKPDIELYQGGSLRVGGAAPMEVKNMKMWVSEGSPCRLLNDCPSMTADSLTSMFYVDANKWYFFTPLHDVELSKVTHSANASYVFRYYDGESRANNGTGSSWRNADGSKLNAGQGYIFHCNSSGWISFPAESTVHSQVFTTEDVTKQLSVYESTATANKSWNYVGNPYPCYYDIYYMDFTAPITVWTGSTYKAYSIADDDFVLRPMQSFFVQKPDAVDNIIFHKEGRQINSSVNRASYAKARKAPEAAENRFFFNLQISEDSIADETRIVLNENASLGYEIESDASKFMSMDTEVAQIFSINNEGTTFAINERPQADGAVRLGYYVGKAGFYTISASRADGNVTLYDKVLNKTVDLTQQDYTFNSDVTNGANTERFVLNLSSNSETTSISEIINRSNGSVEIYNLNGTRLNGNIENTVPGIYVIKENGKTSKVMIK